MPDPRRLGIAELDGTGYTSESGLAPADPDGREDASRLGYQMCDLGYEHDREFDGWGTDPTR